MYESGGVIYADALFLINFCVDYLCLFIAGRLTKRGAKVKRLLSGAALGAAYAFFPLAVALPFPVSLLSHCAAACAVCAAAFGFRTGAKRFFASVGAFIGTEALTGGLTGGLISLCADGGAASGSPAGFAAAIAVSGGAAAAYALACRRKKAALSCEICFEAGGESVKARLLVDSGNLVTEPFSALPVIILSHTALPFPLSSPESAEFPLPLRVVPFRTGAGEGCLYAFRPERLEIGSFAGKRRLAEAYIAVDSAAAEFSGYDGILPAELV